MQVVQYNRHLADRWSLASFMKLVIDVPYYFLLVVATRRVTITRGAP